MHSFTERKGEHNHTGHRCRPDIITSYNGRYLVLIILSNFSLKTIFCRENHVCNCLTPFLTSSEIPFRLFCPNIWPAQTSPTESCQEHFSLNERLLSRMTSLLLHLTITQTLKCQFWYEGRHLNGLNTGRYPKGDCQAEGNVWVGWGYLSRGKCLSPVRSVQFMTNSGLAFSIENMPAFSTSSTRRFLMTFTKDSGFFSMWHMSSCNNSNKTGTYISWCHPLKYVTCYAIHKNWQVPLNFRTGTFHCKNLYIVRGQVFMR